MLFSCFFDRMWFCIVLLFKPNSSRHAEQNNLPPETFNCSFGNSRTRLLGSTLLGSETEFPLHWRLPTGGGLVFVCRFLALAAGVGALSLSNSEGGRLELELPVPLLSSELSELLLGKLLLLLGRLLLGGGVGGPLQAISAR